MPTATETRSKVQATISKALREAVIHFLDLERDELAELLTARARERRVDTQNRVATDLDTLADEILARKGKL